MRSVLAAVLSLALCASAEAATPHRFKPRERTHPPTAFPAGRVTAPTGFAVPGWTDEQTREWLNYGSRGSHQG